ncbi:MAG: tRNA 2-thiouridine(34) synthase MnmA [Rhodospirillaceae bacterium]|nr:tRNA 2-thiouridine(34) synthase MnmA [Rhodospirillaceae bacterium]MYB14130.1 tRNA 2-thiouridine(34) synthase MnmA [Rhodospirillaceae bacterium]MYI49591.1 tRNA 2-thiouridine(34) synthase MnmA [Rhodospirillaceae bacterium]
MAAQTNSLGFAKAPAQTRVAVAMSGGVDSSVTAALLHAEGYDVIGVTLQLYDHGAAVNRPGACCAGQDIRDARRVAEEAGFPHYVLDYESRFRESVIDDFADSYLRGETPLPCVRCNQTVKFTDLLQMARDLDADCLATGHYVRRIEAENGPELHKAADPAKDQSYFLFATTREQLDYLRFPLGGRLKEETRRVAGELGVPVADKPDSQDICFVPDGDYAQVVEKLRPGACEPGRIVDLDGRTLGRHDGIVRFTVGQRRGLGVGGAAAPLYVVKIDAENREVVVGPREALARRRIAIRSLNWLGDGALEDRAPEDGAPEEGAIRAEARIRNTGAAMPCRVEAGADGGATLTFDEPQYGVAAGQAAVLYDGTRMLGGGWIGRA